MEARYLDKWWSANDNGSIPSHSEPCLCQRLPPHVRIGVSHFDDEGAALIQNCVSPSADCCDNILRENSVGLVLEISDGDITEYGNPPLAVIVQEQKA